MTAPASEPAWWRSAVIYQVYPRSFADSDGDGIGDLPGVISRLDHLVDLGVDALWLSPFYPSPQADAGYDVADYYGVDPLFGHIADIEQLIAKAHRRKLRVIVDLVPNHTSDRHPWFREVVAEDPGAPARDRYVIRDGRGADGEAPPNDWPSVFGGPAWTRLPDGQWYLHLFDTAQPDLNWRHPEVRAEFEDILRYWLELGVDGFRVDVAHGLMKADGLPDWPLPYTPTVRSEADGSRPPMWDQDAVHEVYRAWRAIADSYPGQRVLVAEALVSPPERLARYVSPGQMHQAFNFEYLQAPWHAPRLREVIDTSLAAAGAVGAPTTWVLSNHDVIRHATRFAYPSVTELPMGIGATDPQPDRELGLRRARAATLLMLALPGVAYLYQGEELGLPEHTGLPDSVRQDPVWQRTGGAQRGRDGCRVPLPWAAQQASFGFGPEAASWLPLPADWAEYALDRQHADPTSTYHMYRHALRLRRRFGLGHGPLNWLDAGPETVAFRNGDVLVIANLGDKPVPLPDATAILHSSVELADGTSVPSDTTIWALVPPQGREE
jgi:alpha-glucosidase